MDKMTKSDTVGQYRRNDCLVAVRGPNPVTPKSGPSTPEKSAEEWLLEVDDPKLIQEFIRGLNPDQLKQLEALSRSVLESGIRVLIGNRLNVPIKTLQGRVTKLSEIALRLSKNVKR